MKLILGGHWTEPPASWRVLSEQECDITGPLPWQDSTVDTIFTEHVIEHVNMVDACLFFQQAKRVLKPGGILRTVAPFIDQMIQLARQKHVGGELYRSYTNTSLIPYYKEENITLMGMSIQLSTHALPFFFDSLLKKHNHKFVWSSQLMAAVLLKIGFSDVRICLPGESEFDTSNCIERTVRGIEPFPDVKYFDPESLVVEARK